MATPFGIVPRQIVNPFPPAPLLPNLGQSLVRLPQAVEPQKSKKKKPRKVVVVQPESSSEEESSSSDESDSSEEEETITRYAPLDARRGPGFPPGFPHHMFPPGSTVEVKQKLPHPHAVQYIEPAQTLAPRALPITNLSMAPNLGNLPFAVGSRSILL
jgi:hypothetical protein